MKQTRILRYAFVLLVPTLLLGCTRMNVISLSDQSLPQLQHWSQVAVYENIAEVSESYQEVAVLEITTAATKKKMIRDSQRRAADMGANGIVLEHLGKHTDFNLIFNGLVFVPVSDDRWDGRILVILVI